MKYTFLLLIVCLISCGTSEKEEKKEKNYAGMAIDLCACMTPLSDLYEQVLIATEAQDTATIESLVGDFEKLSQEGEDCAAKLEAKYGDFIGEEEVKAKAAIREKCPKIADMMEGGAQ